MLVTKATTHTGHNQTNQVNEEEEEEAAHKEQRNINKASVGVAWKVQVPPAVAPGNVVNCGVFPKSHPLQSPLPTAPSDSGNYQIHMSRPGAQHHIELQRIGEHSEAAPSSSSSSSSVAACQNMSSAEKILSPSLRTMPQNFAAAPRSSQCDGDDDDDYDYDADDDDDADEAGKDFKTSHASQRVK